jgi:hypothetical protein
MNAAVLGGAEGAKRRSADGLGMMMFPALPARSARRNPPSPSRARTGSGVAAKTLINGGRPAKRAAI